jgi:hypothetical protein
LEPDPVGATFSVLGGDVLEAVACWDAATKSSFVAAIRRSNRTYAVAHAHLLEPMGETHRLIWTGPELFRSGEHKLEAIDLDSDGVCELVFEDESRGRAAGQRFLHIYHPSSQKVFTLTEDYEWGRLGRPPSPAVGWEPEPPKELRRILEAHAIRRGFLKREHWDLDDPQYAAARWLRDNGSNPEGRLLLHPFRGKPALQSSISAEVDTETHTWTAFYKGPVCCYEKSADIHFVVYAPDWMYDWAKGLAWDGQRAWFGIHCSNGVLCFNYEQKSLRRITKVGSVELPEVESIKCEDGNVVLNNNLILPRASMGRI